MPVLVKDSCGGSILHLDEAFLDSCRSQNAPGLISKSDVGNTPWRTLNCDKDVTLKPSMCSFNLLHFNKLVKACLERVGVLIVRALHEINGDSIAKRLSPLPFCFARQTPTSPVLPDLAPGPRPSHDGCMVLKEDVQAEQLETEKHVESQVQGVAQSVRPL